jgi:O-antigen/teichoic acid export membrane protein
MNLRKVLSASLIYGGGSAVNPVLKLILVPVYIRYLNPEQYGIVGIAFAISSFLAVLFTMGLDGATSREYFDHEGRDSEGFRAYVVVIGGLLLAVALVFGSALSGIGVLFGDSIKDTFQIEVYPYVLLALFIALIAPFNAVGMVVLQVEQRAGSFAVAQICRTIVGGGIALGLLVVVKAGAASILWGEAIALLFVSLGLWIWLTKGWPGKGETLSIGKAQGATILKKGLTFGLPLVPQGLSNWLISLSDRAMLLYYGSLAWVGVYTFGFSISLVMMMAISALNNAYLPFFLANASRSDFAQSHKVFSHMYVIAVGAICLLIGGFSTEITQVIGTGEYKCAGEIVCFLVIAYYWEGIYLMTVLPIYHQRKTRILPVLVGGAALANVIASFLLIPRFGIVGAALAKIVSYVCLCVWTWRVSEKGYRVGYSPLNFWTAAICVSSITVIASYQQLFVKISMALCCLGLGLMRLLVLWRRNKAESGCALAA